MPPNTKVSIDRKNTYKSKRYGHEEITHSIRAGGHNKSEPIPPLDRSALIAQGSYEKCPRLTAILTQFGFYLLIFLGYLNQLLFPPKVTKERNREGYAPLYRPFDQFYSRYVYRRVRHCFNRPVSSAPAEEITLMERSSDDYNWTMKGGKKEVEDAARSYGLVLSSPRAELGSCQLHEQLENELAEFFGVEAAVVVGNGFLTNLLTLSALVGPDSLVLSDDSNHTSLILGMRLAQVPVRVFRHNDMKHLEQLAREARAEGRWQKIVIVLEGIYSMTGSLAALPAAVALKKQLGLHIYIDEAHSIGLGPRGRGATDACGVDPRDVDVLMGTFSKSFPGAGGYIAGSAALVSHLRAHGAAHAYVQAMPPPVTAQVLCALRDLRAPAGQARVIALKENIRYFRDRLQSMGVVVHGHEQSPVAAMLVYSPSKMVACVERLTAAGVAAAGVSFPATPMHQARMRFCLSAAHTREHLDTALAAIEAATDELGLRYSRQNKAIPQ
ncbi:serine palmitoyltransferase 3-like isoform X2 [Leguminivora glycinivorella]|uniref:serine palmitoyltransferase 3-like isoform X2 n=1 Tax=Leguminivora glycinivorella TaxID=1035111 RepID=UPI00200D194F|nr:serine palmitoyltransferase 3-like isoform X2 [Leguminivora glycinivorella]